MRHFFPQAVERKATVHLTSTDHCMLNRSIKPSTPAIPSLHLPEPSTRQINQTIPLHIYQSDKQPVIELDITWKAGTWYSHQGIVPFFTGEMLQRGTPKKGAQDIAEIFDQYGAQIGITAEKDTMHCQLTVVASLFEKVFPTFAEILCTPTFPEEGMHICKKSIAAQIKRHNADSSFLAQKALRYQLFGEKHPYGYSLLASDIASLTRDSLEEHFKTHGWHAPQMILTGQVRSKHIKMIESYFSHIPAKEPAPLTHHPTLASAQKKHISHPTAMQTSIAVGHKTITQSHADYPALLVANTLLGGYFGSRLMRNIREEKGYTYGVHGRIHPWVHHGYWTISANVKHEHREATLSEIEKEITRLQTDLVSKEELAALQSYLTGHLLAKFDGPFSLAKHLRTVTMHGLNMSYYNALYTTIQTITPEHLRQIAQTYFQLDKIAKITVGQ